jgi:non-specific serine/threonine protein kinase/serine/threonine-protein kinase
LVAGLLITLHEAQVARSNELRAERRFDEVRSLANSLVFEIHDSIRQLPGATKARQMLVKRAQEYLERLSAEASTNVALLRELAETYEKLAAIQGDFTNSNVGDVTAALQSYRKSAALLESAAALEPANQAIQRDCARSYLELARALSQSEMPAENSAYLQRAERILRSLSVTAQNDKQLQYLLAKTYELTAKRLAKDKDLESALSHYRKAAAIYGELHQAQPDDANYLTEVSFSHKHIGAVLAVQKQYAAALEQYQAARAIDEHRIATNPQNLDYRYAVTFDYSDIGYIIGKQGDVDQALEYYRKSLEIRSAMAVEDPDDARTKRGSHLDRQQPGSKKGLRRGA